MDHTSTEVIEAAAAGESLDALLADLDMDAAGPADQEVIDEMSASDADVIEHIEAMDAAYEGQETSTVEVTATVSEPEAEAPTTGKKARKPRAAKAAKPAAAPKDLASIDTAHFVLEDGVTDLDANKAHVIALIPKQKKIAEKFENFFRAISVGKAPSTFVTTCFAVLNGKEDDVVTSTELVGALKAADYNEGTARSQVGQIMVLFDLLKIAKRDGQKLTLDREAPMTKKLAALPLTK